MDNYDQLIADAVWVANTLSANGNVTGSSANLSIKHKDVVYITRSGALFGRLTKDDFAMIDLMGRQLGLHKPSKEAPIHLALYQRNQEIEAVIHTHSFYSVLWSCLIQDHCADSIPSYTPYLQMLLGKVPLVPYHKPGSEPLFQAFRHALCEANGYLLKNHGPVVGGTSIIDAFCKIEELEISARTAWYLSQQQEVVHQINKE